MWLDVGRWKLRDDGTAHRALVTDDGQASLSLMPVRQPVRLWRSKVRCSITPITEQTTVYRSVNSGALLIGHANGRSFCGSS